MKFLAFAASHRPDSYNRRLINVAATHLLTKGSQVDVVLYDTFDMPVYKATLEMPEICHTFAKHAEHADGIIIAAPEYNWSYPGSLKNIIEWTSCIKPYPLAGKTALLMSASPGARGGILGLNHLKSPLEEIELIVYQKVFPLGHCMEAFAGDVLVDSKQHKHLTTILDGYVTFTQKLANHP